LSAKQIEQKLAPRGSSSFGEGASFLVVNSLLKPNDKSSRKNRQDLYMPRGLSHTYIHRDIHHRRDLHNICDDDVYDGDAQKIELVQYEFAEHQELQLESLWLQQVG
jgi:hypothetical protein